MFITVNRNGDTVSGALNGKPYAVRFDEARYAAMKSLAQKAAEALTMEELVPILSEFEPYTQEGYGTILKERTPYLIQDMKTLKFHLRFKDGISAHEIPKSIANKLIYAAEQKLEIDPLVKCIARFMRNPKYTSAKAHLFANYLDQTYVDNDLVAKLKKEQGFSHESAVAAATVHQTPITMEGLISTYKVSTEYTDRYRKDESAEDGVKKVHAYDFDVDELTGLKKYKVPEVESRIFIPTVQGFNGDAFYCYKVEDADTRDQTAGHFIRVGHVHELPDWSMVNTDDRDSCVEGLHCGNLDYIRGYQSKGTVTHYTFVDPEDIGAIVQDNTGALRVRRYYTYRTFDGVQKNLYNSSRFAALTDKDYAKLVEEAVSRNKITEAEFVQGLAQQAAEKQQLLSI